MTGACKGPMWGCVLDLRQSREALMPEEEEVRGRGDQRPEPAGLRAAGMTDWHPKGNGASRLF